MAIAFMAIVFNFFTLFTFLCKEQATPIDLISIFSIWFVMLGVLGRLRDLCRWQNIIFSSAYESELAVKLSFTYLIVLLLLLYFHFANPELLLHFLLV